MIEKHPFVESLYRLAERNDRAALAELRRSLTRPLAAMPYVAPFLREGATEHEERSLVLVAALFALHPEAGHLTVAKGLRLLSDASDSVALRFRALLDSDLAELPVHLRHAVALLRSKDIAVDFDDLLRTVRGWEYPSKSEQRRWAREFWSHTEIDETETKDDSQ